MTLLHDDDAQGDLETLTTLIVKLEKLLCGDNYQSQAATVLPTKDEILLECSAKKQQECMTLLVPLWIESVFISSS
jgi:hypothetical protein